MGLDIYFFEKEKQLNEQGQTVMTEFAYWRKHNRLMTAIGEVLDESIENCTNYQLTVPALDELIRRANEEELGESAEGFFWGSARPYTDEDRENDIDAFTRAKKAIEDGSELFFRAWW